MITLLICYTLDMHKLKDFKAYARRWPEPIRRCAGDLRGYFLPTKLAGPAGSALALIDFPDLASYERYRQVRVRDPEALANVAAADTARRILVEDRSFLQRV